jgi:hypothetical protein
MATGSLPLSCESRPPCGSHLLRTSASGGSGASSGSSTGIHSHAGSPGCGNLWTGETAGQDGYDYEGVDGDQAIQVGIDYDTFSDIPTCYDGRDPISNDFAFLPWLMNTIESEFCVDVNHQYLSEYHGEDGSVMSQMNCAYPDKLRGSVILSGCEAGAAGFPGMLPPCVSNKPTAAFYVHDINDTNLPYSCILPSCARVLAQNGCSVTTCDPMNTALTTPYSPPAGVVVPGSCVSFNGCPADYPVVFCVLHGTQSDDVQTSWGITKLFWDFMSNRLAD